MHLIEFSKQVVLFLSTPQEILLMQMRFQLHDADRAFDVQLVAVQSQWRN
jgi:hypothetical protein